jgi:hypothetical protein
MLCPSTLRAQSHMLNYVHLYLVLAAQPRLLQHAVCWSRVQFKEMHALRVVRICLGLDVAVHVEQASNHGADYSGQASTCWNAAQQQQPLLV